MEEPVNQLIDAIKGDDLSALFSEETEHIIDTIFANEVVDDIAKEIPVLNKIIATAKFGIKIKNWFFAKKIKGFLLQLEQIESDKRMNFVKKLERQKLRQQVGETLITVLDRLDHIKKAEITGKLFKSYILEEIKYDTFITLTSVIERIFITDIQSLQNNQELSQLQKERFYSIGIYSMNLIDGGPSAIYASYSINDLGNQLLNILKEKL